MAHFLLAVAIIIGLVLLPVLFAARNAFGRAAMHGAAPENDVVSARRGDNIAAYKQQLAVLDAQLASAEIDAATYRQLTSEAKQQLLQEAQTQKVEGQNGFGQPQRDRVIVFIAALAIPFTALLIYLPSGFSLGYLDQFLVVEKMAELAESDNSEQMLNEVIATAEQQTKSTHADPQLLHLLASIYRSLGRYDDALQSLERSLVKDENANTLAMMVELQYMQQLDQMQKRAQRGDSDKALFTPLMQSQLARALQLNPNQPDALSLSGIQSFRAGRYPEAVEFWKKALASYPPMSAQSRTLQESIQVALQRAGNSGGELSGDSALASAQAVIRLRVSIDKSQLKASDSPSTPVFVFARPVSGPRMPLAAKRLTLADLPLDIVLSNNDAMAGRSIADVDAVLVGARLARGGQPTFTAGDLESTTHEMTVNKLGSNGIEVFDEAALSALEKVELRINNLRP